MRKMTILAVAAALFAAAMAPATAASWRNQPGALSVTVDPVAETYTYHGEGFNSDAWIYINECRPGCTASFAAGFGPSFDIVRPFGCAGDYEGTAIVQVFTGNSWKPKTVQVATVSFVVPDLDPLDPCR